MTTPAERRAKQHEQIAEVMEDTEARMHETADKLRSPKREALHQRARRVTKRARQHEALAEEIREQDD